MSVVACSGKKLVGPEFQKSFEIVKAVYDYSVDGGGQNNFTLLTAQGACIVKMAALHVKASVTSGSSATVSIGKTSGTEFANAVGKATLVSGYVVGSTGVVQLAAGDVVALTVGTANLTAGKIEVTFEVFAA